MSSHDSNEERPSKKVKMNFKYDKRYRRAIGNLSNLMDSQPRYNKMSFCEFRREDVFFKDKQDRDCSYVMLFTQNDMKNHITSQEHSNHDCEDGSDLICGECVEISKNIYRIKHGNTLNDVLMMHQERHNIDLTGSDISVYRMTNENEGLSYRPSCEVDKNSTQGFEPHLLNF